MQLVLVFVVGVLLGYTMGWQSALDVVFPKIIKAVQLLKEAGCLQEELLEPKELERIFKEADAA